MRALGSPDGQAVLRSLPPYDESRVLRLQTELRREGHSPEFVAAVLTQQRLRARAVAKFGEFAGDMLYTADGLEQASRLEVAATHAGRFYNASLATVHDLGCGIGSDAVAMSALGVTVHGVDLDPVTAAVADINLRPWPDSRARQGMAEEFEAPRDPLRARVGVWLDPARRVPGHIGRHGRIKRVFRLDEIRPTWDFVLQVATAVPATGAKLSPVDAARRHPARHRGAVDLVRRRGARVRRVVGSPRPAAGAQRPHPRARGPRRSRSTRRWPSPTHRWPAACRRWGRGSTSPTGRSPRRGCSGRSRRRPWAPRSTAGLGYVVSEAEVDVPFARRYAVREVMPFSTKVLRSWLAQHGVTGLTIKKRGVRLDDDELRRQLRIGRKAGGGAQATVILTRVAGQQSVLVVDPA